MLEQDLESRPQESWIDLLERSQRRIRLFAAAMSVVTILLAGETLRLASGHARTIEAEQFVVKDSAGKVRARLGVREDGLPELVLLDRRGAVQVALHIYSDDAAALAFIDRDQTRVQLDSSGNGSASLRFADKSGQGRSTLFLSPDGTSGLNIEHNQASVLVGVKPGEHSGLLVTDARGREAGRVGSTDLTPSLLGFRTTPQHGFNVVPNQRHETTATAGSLEEARATVDVLAVEALPSEEATPRPSLPLGQTQGR